MSDSEQKKEISWSDVDESPVIPTGVPKEEPPMVDLSASVSKLASASDTAEPSKLASAGDTASADNTAKPVIKADNTASKPSDVSPTEPQDNPSSPSVPQEEKELNQEIIDKLLNKLMEFDDMPPLVDDDDMPALVYDSCPRCDAALRALLTTPVRRHPVINIESDSSEDSTEESTESSDSDSDYVPSESDSSPESDPPTPRTIADRQVNVPSAIQYITFILAVLYLVKFLFFMNENRIRYRPCT